jgi:hypothetical protein
MTGHFPFRGRRRLLFGGFFVLLILLAACRDSRPTATPAAEVAQATSRPEPTGAPLPSATPTIHPTETAVPSPTATATTRPSPTPRPELVVLVQDESGQPVAGASVRLVGAIRARRTAGDDGRVTFTAPRSGPYRLEVAAEGYAGYDEAITIGDGPNELTVTLVTAATATPTAAATRSPTATVTAAPATAAPVAALPPAAQPSGPNLLANPGFEQGRASWHFRVFENIGVQTFALHDYPQFIHSGAQAARGGWYYGYYQQVSGVTPGTTYRFTIWAKMWSSTGDDRTVSENPDPNAVMYICINTNGDDDRWLPPSICSSPARPLDIWQNLAVEAVATNDRIAVILYATTSTRPAPPTETLWDDAYLGLAPFAATPTPAPQGPPVPPAPVAFAAGALRDSMLILQNALVQIGGLLDRLYNGESATCAEYEGYYRQIVESQSYHSVPADWQGIHNDYTWAAEHGRTTNEAVYLLCQGGGGILTELNYGVARTGINESLDRLNPAVVAADALLGQ